MSATDAPLTTATGHRPYDEISKDWRSANLRPLWESALAHKVREGGPAPHHWKWKVVRPLIDDAMKVTTPAAVERRVLTLTDPEAIGGAGSTSTNLATGFQILLPGESARPHRHTMNALRFVVEGKGASTVVDGKDCPMEEGDLVITPGWTWHEHVHHGHRRRSSGSTRSTPRSTAISAPTCSSRGPRTTSRRCRTTAPLPSPISCRS